MLYDVSICRGNISISSFMIYLRYEREYYNLFREYKISMAQETDITLLCIFSFLGHFVGTVLFSIFAVKLKNSIYSLLKMM